MVNYYEALDVTRSASTTIIKIAYDAKLAEVEASELPEKERRAAERALSTAYYVLSNTQKRQEYDARLDSIERKAQVSSWVKPYLVPGIVVIAIIGGISLYASQRAQTRERIRTEEARIARDAEITKINAARDAAAAEERRSQAERDEAQQQSRYERERDRARSSSSDYNSYDSRVDRSRQTYQEQQLQREQQYAEERDRRQAEADHQRALSEVERQKRFVQQREAEEEQARLRRHERTLQDERERAAREAPAPPPDTSSPVDPRVRKP